MTNTKTVPTAILLDLAMKKEAVIKSKKEEQSKNQNLKDTAERVGTSIENSIENVRQLILSANCPGLHNKSLKEAAKHARKLRICLIEAVKSIED
jgi:2-phospho-L-lactate guanylyltransferase (CobY/MobA/RfbA family)